LSILFISMMNGQTNIKFKKFIFRISNHTSPCEKSSTLLKISNRKTHYNKEYNTLFVGKIHVKKKDIVIISNIIVTDNKIIDTS